MINMFKMNTRDRKYFNEYRRLECLFSTIETTGYSQV